MGLSLKNIAKKTWDQLNMLDDDRTWQNPKGSGTKRSAWQQVTNQAKRAGTGVGLGVTRAVTGIGQAGTGLVDLATPGRGTNRASDLLDNFAKLTDRTAKAEGVGGIYKGAQIATDIASIAGGVGLAKLGAKGVTKAPQVSKFVRPVQTALNKVDTITEPWKAQGIIGKAGAAGVRGIASPTNAAANAMVTAKMTGEDASKGKDISLGGVATDVALNAGFELGLPAAGVLAKEGIKRTPQLVRKGVGAAKDSLKLPDEMPVKVDAGKTEKPRISSLKPEAKKAVKDIHTAARKQGLSDEQYREVLVKTTGKDSTLKMSSKERQAVLQILTPPKGELAGKSLANKMIAESRAAKVAGTSSRTARMKTKLQETVFDPLAGYQKSDRLTAKVEGKKQIEAHRSLPKLQNDVQNNEAIFLDKVERMALDDTGTTVQKVMQKHNHQEERFMNYVAAKVDLENRKFKDGVKLHPDKTSKQLKAIIAEFESVNPGADADARVFKRMKDVIDREAIKTGMGDAPVTARQYYFPTKRIESEAKQKMQVRGRIRGGNTTTTIQSRKENFTDIDYSYQAALDSLSKSHKKVLENRLFNEAYGRAEKGTIGAKIVKPDGKVDVNRLAGFIGNKKAAIELDENLSRAMAKLDQQSSDAFSRWFWQLPASAAKVMYTGVLNPVFHAIQMAKNPLVMVHNGGLRTLDPRTLHQAFAGAVGRGQFGERNLTKYGANQIKGITQTASKAKVRADMIALNKKDPKQLAKFVFSHPTATVKEALHFTDRLYAVSDRTFRSQMAAVEYHRVVGKVGHEKAMEAAARAYNEGMGNFNRVTNAARAVEPILLYAGATQAGARSFVRAYRDRPLETLAIDAALVGGIGYLITETMASDKGKQFYDDMKASKKEYVLDDNIIIVPPTASRDDKTGEWKGVIKIPLAPDFRPLNRTIRKERTGDGWHPEDLAGHFTGDVIKSTKEIPTNNPTVNAASVAMNRDPRYGGAIDSEFQEQTLAPKDRVNKNTSNFAKQVAETTGLSPQKVDKWLDNAGLTGDMLQNRDGGGIIGVIKESFKKQFGKGIKGEGTNASFYKDLEASSSKLKDEKDWQSFKLLHTKTDNKGTEDGAARALLLLNQPNVLAAENDLNRRRVARGEPSNPFYDLAPEQQNAVLRYRSNKAMNSAKQNYDKDGNSLFTSLGLTEQWYQDFRDKENAFYQLIGTDSDDEQPAKTFSGKPYVKDDAMEALQSEFFKLSSGTGEKSAFIQEHPELLEYWAQKDDFTNAERAALGLRAIGDDGGGSSSGSGSYSRYGGSGGGSSATGMENAYKFAVEMPQVSPRVKENTIKVSKPTVKSRSKTTVKKPKLTRKKSKA